MTHRFKALKTIALACTVAGSTLVLPALAGELKAGAGKVMVTPEATEFPYTVPREKTFVGVHDDVYARAIALDDGRKRVVLVSLEATLVPNPDQVVAAVAKAVGVPTANVMVTATHTHNVLLTFFHGGEPSDTQKREMARLQDGAVEAAKQAVASLAPAKISFGRGQAFVNTNNGEEAGHKYWYDASGSSDKSLDILRLQTADGKPLALMLNYATHGEVMFRSVTKDGGYEVSGDLPGAVSRILEGQAAGAPVVLFTSAAEGDQLPLFKSLQPDSLLPGTDEGAAGWGILDLQARRLAMSAMETISTMPAGDDKATLFAASAPVTCPGQHYNVDHATGKLVGIDDTGPLSIPLSVIRINDLALAGIGGDIASDIGKSIKSASPLPNTTLVTMTAGSVGYILNDANYEHPGHGAFGSPVKPGCAAHAISNGLNQLLAASK
jgi:hypothetical protein